MSESPRRIVIVGAGFAGLYAYLALHKQFHNTGKVAITLINETDQFVFVPMLHEVATGTLTPASITTPLRSIPHCCLERFIEGRAEHVHLEEKNVSVLHRPHDLSESAGIRIHVPYDYLVLATGSTTNFFGVPGAAEHALPLKTIADAAQIKNRIIELFERAEGEPNGTKHTDILRTVIVGGGPTGVELAGELADLLNEELTHAFPKIAPRAEIVVLDRNEVFLKEVGPWFSEKAREILGEKGRVSFRGNTGVTRVTPEGVETTGGVISAGMVVWAAGVAAHDPMPSAAPNVVRDEKRGRVRVNEFLHLSAYPEVFVAGDLAWAEDLETRQPYPMRAQFAVREGRTVGENIARLIRGEPLRAFEWNEHGFILSLGKGGALAKIFGVRLSGIVAWVMYRAAYIFSSFGARAKMRMSLEWLLNLFLPRDISKLADD